MTEKECYAVLEIANKSDIDTVKKAYRRLAFALHPDLNPSLADAGRRFQLVNEAYVTLVKLGEGKTYTRKDQQKTSQKSSQQNAETTERVKREAEKAYAKAKKQQSTAEHTGEKPADSTTNSAPFNHEKAHEEASTTFSAQDAKAKERVINDILHDPFAKRVFEDIYKRIQDITHDKILRPAAETVLGAKERRQNSSVSTPLLKRLKGWVLRQIDDEQTLRLPRERIIPGARVRMQIQHGIASEIQTIEVTLPLEFGPGKTMRLKGLGKRVGGLAGDLYIRIEPN